MAIIKWSPYKDVERLRKSFSRFFDEEFLPISARDLDSSTRFWAPDTDITEKEDRFLLQMDIPGIHPDDIHVEFIGDKLIIKGEKKCENEEKNENCHILERQYGNFQRSFTFGIPVQNDNISASYENGVLKIEIPKADKVLPKKISIDIKKA